MKENGMATFFDYGVAQKTSYYDNPFNQITIDGTLAYEDIQKLGAFYINM